MLDSATVQDLLTGGLDTQSAGATRSWIDDFKRQHGVQTDLDAIQVYSDTELIPRLARAKRLFSNEALLACDFIGLPTPRFAVQLIRSEGHQIIAIHEGFLHLVGFLNEADLIAYILHDRLTYLEPAAVQALSVQLRIAMIRIATRFLVEPWRLPSLWSEFTTEFKTRFEDEIISIVAFAVLHELAHAELGHWKPPTTGAAVSTSPHLVIDEPLGHFKQLEFEADEHAIRSVRSHHTSFCAGVALFLRYLALLETFSVRDRPTHPMAANRLSHLASILPADFSAEIIDLLRSGARHIATTHATHREDDLHWHFELLALASPERPVEDYWAIAKTIIRGSHILAKYDVNLSGLSRPDGPA
jgi:hypothetical protein